MIIFAWLALAIAAGAWLLTLLQRLYAADATSATSN
jgi:hypothetical protein